MIKTAKIIAALEYGREAHKGQKRKYIDEEYFCHPIRVAEMVSKYTHDEDIIIAALLHDVVEDCEGYEITDIFEKFGASIALYVKDLTHIKISPRKSSHHFYNEQLARSPRGTHAIKVCDMIDNIPSIREFDPGFWDSCYFSESIDKYKVLVKAPALSSMILKEIIYEEK